jgi:Uma2 family endonuclease
VKYAARSGSALLFISGSATLQAMTALLDMPEIRERVSPLSVAEYHQLGEFNENGRRTELIRGILIEKMSKSPLHYYLIETLRRMLSGQMQRDWDLRQEGPLTTADSEPEPDLAVVTGLLEEFRNAHPRTAALAVEVAVPSLSIDRVKALIYAEAGVTEYWIVCPEQKQVEVYRKPGPQGYAERIIVAAPALLESAALAGVRVDLGALFA